MKKVFVLAAAAIMMVTANVKAQEINNVKVASPVVNYNVNMNMRSLTRFLLLDEQQASVMAYASDNLIYDLRKAGNEKEVKQPAAVREAVTRNLKLAHNILDDKQYRDYLTVLNRTLNNKGLALLMQRDENVAMAE